MKFKRRDKSVKMRGSVNRVPSGCLKYLRQSKRAFEKACMERFLQTMNEDALYPVRNNEADDIWGWD